MTVKLGRWLIIVVWGLASLGGGCQLFEKPKPKGPSNSLNLGTTSTRSF